MPIPRFSDVAHVPLPTDRELVPHLQSLLEGGYRRQVWIMMLDGASRPLPLLVPCDVPAVPDMDDVLALADSLRCLALDFDSATLVLTFERPGPPGRTEDDLRWIRMLREACVASEMPFRGPYLLTGTQVQPIPPDELM